MGLAAPRHVRHASTAVPPGASPELFGETSLQPHNAQIKKSSESLLRGLSFHPEHSGGQLMDVRRRNGVIVLNSVCKVML